MSYRQTLERLFALRRRGVDFDLARPRRVAAALGDPQEAYPVVHVGGTNGKGSTAAMLDSILRAAGRRTGLYTSPHLLRFTERMRVNGHEIAPDDVVRWIDAVEQVGEPLTFFEIATLAALGWFREQRIDACVLEVGLGGRLDATNIVAAPAVTVVTGVAHDHHEYLGPTLPDIAREKAGIFKPGRPAVVALPEDAAAARVLVDRAAEVGAPISIFGRDFDDRGLPPLLLAGAHQRSNAALAKQAARLMGIPDAAIDRGLREARWPGRLERVGDVLFDCAHNADAAQVLAASLSERPHLVFGALADKDAAAMLELLAPACASVVVTAPPSPRAADPRALARLWPGAVCEPDPERALARAGRPALVTGSIYLVGHLRGVVLGEPRDPLPVGDPLGLVRG